ncbi:DNA polymerase III subunits gamma/tau [Antrihabitans cavernicola]|uniref:DNA polymerase III subunit gamma/tau n=1 Tax=Antrihabitans cavernicola TaxID=2495913 RepID=A0A5A7SJZ9_9NOCA|nr:DNA polymerase III subunits gamma/tau [Spelaeibacter cavernicola]KAA0024521.1 DNA polymerase III subunits gamma/tau [Spelaeibacter cavernicola]
MALYRKYRPATFAEVVGQEHVTEPLSTALDAGRINHAYLFSGPRGCGKTSSARILARSLNCEQGPTSTPCGVCGSCVALAPGGPGNLDVIELDAASHGGVDDTRELRDRAFYAPAESRYRVFIVDEAHMVTTAGFNALLKIVEEPPEHLIFVFATTEPDKVLATIRSRTHHYPFRLLAPTVMRGLLERICAQESVTVDDAVYPLVIRAGGGSPRDSLSVLDQLLAGAGSEGVTYPRALALLGVTDIALIDEAVDALAVSDGAALFGTVEKVMEAGHDPRRFAVDLLERFRDLILLRAIPDAGERGMVEAPGDVLERMRDEAERIGPATLARYAELVHEGLGEMRGATAPRLLLEVMCARMLLPSASDAESAALQRIERIERRLDVTRPAGEQEAAAVHVEAPKQVASQSAREAAVRSIRRPEPKVEQAAPVPPAAPTAPVEPVVPVEPARVRDTPPTPDDVRGPLAQPEAEPVAATPEPEPADPGQPDAAAVRAVWSEVRSKVRERSRTVEVMLSGASVAAVRDNTIVLAHESAPLAKRLVEPRNAEVIRDALKDLFGVDWDVQCDTGAAAPAPPPKPARQQQQKSTDGPPRFSRPSKGRVEQPPARARDSQADDVPPPEAPDYPDDPGPPDPDAAPVTTAQDEEEMLADAAEPVPPGERRDPDDVALELLQSELGAKKIDESQQ